MASRTGEALGRNTEIRHGIFRAVRPRQVFHPIGAPEDKSAGLARIFRFRVGLERLDHGRGDELRHAFDLDHDVAIGTGAVVGALREHADDLEIGGVRGGHRVASGIDGRELASLDNRTGGHAEPDFYGGHSGGFAFSHDGFLAP